MGSTPRTFFKKLFGWMRLLNSMEEIEKMPTSQEDMKLSEAMEKGIGMRKKRATGVYFAGEDRSDCLGAAYQGLTGESEVHNYQVDGKLETAFPILKRKVSNPETGEVVTLKAVIRQLNDKHQWKRRNVVRFIKSVEDRLTIQRQSVEN